MLIWTGVVKQSIELPGETVALTSSGSTLAIPATEPSYTFYYHNPSESYGALKPVLFSQLQSADDSRDSLDLFLPVRFGCPVAHDLLGRSEER